MKNADTLHYRVEQDTDVNALMSAFLNLTNKQLRKLKNRKAVVIVDYTHEPFFGKTQNDWVHGYRPAPGSRGCYKFLAASIVVDNQRYFVYAKPVSTVADETFELWQMLAHLHTMGIRPKVVLMDRGLARDSENLALLHDLGIKYLGLYPKYRNIKKIVAKMKRSFINRKFKVFAALQKAMEHRDRFQSARRSADKNKEHGHKSQVLFVPCCSAAVQCVEISCCESGIQEVCHRTRKGCGLCLQKTNIRIFMAW